MATYYDSSAKPQFDITVYLAPLVGAYQGYRGFPNRFEARTPNGRGNTRETPVQVPRDYRISGVNVEISVPLGIFYDYRIDDCHYYTDLFDVSITSESIIDKYGEGYGFPIALDRTEPPNGYIEIRAQDLGEGSAYMRSLSPDGDPIYIYLMVKCWQVWDPDPRVWDEPPWSYDYRLYRSDPLYLEDATFIYCTSEPSNAEVHIKNADAPYGILEFVGRTPMFYFTPRGFSGTHAFDVNTAAAGYKPLVETHTLCWASNCWTTGTRYWSHSYAALQPLGCSSPSGTVEHGTTNCDGYDLYQCTRGTWELIERNTPACGYPKPTADFDAQWIDGSPPCEVSFTDLSYGNPRAWVWDFGDGTGSTEQHPTHTYTTPGTFTVHLEASNQSGSDVATDTIHIMHPCINPDAPHGDQECVGLAWSECDDGTWSVLEEQSGKCGYQAPIASFVISSIGSWGLSFQFEDTSTPTPTSWLWDFGDGNTSDEQHPTHTYDTSGTYTVVLQASNHVGESIAEVELDVEELSPEPQASGTIVGIGLAAVAAVGVYAATHQRKN